MPPVNSFSDFPLVSAMMLTGHQAKRWPLAEAALKSFLDQTYRPRELVILNQSLGTDFQRRLTPSDMEADGCRVREFLVHRPMTLGDARNMALELTQGEWLLSWDDDDWSHPTRIQWQMSYRRPDRAVAFTSRIHYSFLTRRAFVWHDRHHGCGGLILFPRRPGLRYPAQDVNEDTRLYRDHFYADKVLVENSHFPHVYLRFHHGENTWHAKHIMLGLAGVSPAERLQIHGPMPAVSRDYLRQVLATHYAAFCP